MAAGGRRSREVPDHQLPHWSDEPLRLPAPTPLLERMLAGEKEEALMKLICGRRLLEEHRTASPWCITNKHQYLEAANKTNGRTALHLAAERDLAQLATCLVANRARVDLQDYFGRTALMVASAAGCTQAASALLEARAALDTKDNGHRQPLHHAVQRLEAAPAMVQLLVRARADINARDVFGHTPLALASAANIAEPVAALLNNGGATITFDLQGRLPLDLAKSSRRRPYSMGGSLGAARGEWLAKRPVTTNHREDAGEPLLAPPAAALTATDSLSRSSACSPRYSWRRWDNLGETSVQQQLLLEERAWRRRPVEPLKVAERDRLHAATGLLC